MDYLNNLLVGPSNKLKTTGIVMGSICVGIVGIVSAAFLSYGIMQATISTTSTIDNISPQLTITSTNATNIVSSLKSSISQDLFDKLNTGNAFIYLTGTSYNVITFSADVTDNAIVQFDVALSINPCPGLKIYKIDTGKSEYDEYSRIADSDTAGLFTGAVDINFEKCSFSLYIKDNGRGDEDIVLGKIADPLIVSYETTTVPTDYYENYKKYATAASTLPCNQESALNAYKFAINLYSNTDPNLNLILGSANLLTLTGQSTLDTDAINKIFKLGNIYYEKYCKDDLVYRSPCNTARDAYFSYLEPYNATMYVPSSVGWSAHYTDEFPIGNGAYRYDVTATQIAAKGYVINVLKGNSSYLKLATTCAAGLMHLNVYTLITTTPAANVDGFYILGGKIDVIDGSATTSQINLLYKKYIYKAPMPNPNSFFGTAVLYNLIYTIGGTGNNSFQFTSYDPFANVWHTFPVNLTTARSRLSATALSGTLYAIGGKDIDGYDKSSVEYYTPGISANWKNCAQQIRSPRSGLMSATVNNNIYIIGGTNSAGAVFYTMDQYSCNGGSLINKTDMNYARAYAGVAVLNNLIYVIGGYGARADLCGNATSGCDSKNSTELNTVEYYNTTSNTWTLVDSMQISRFELTSVATDRLIYAIGGTYGSNPVTSVEIYNATSDKWTMGTKLTTALSGMGAAFIHTDIPTITTTTSKPATTTSTTITNADISPKLEIVSAGATNITLSIQPISQDMFNNSNKSKGLIYSSNTSYNSIDFSADVTINNMIVQFNVSLSTKPCSGLKIYKPYNKTGIYAEYVKQYINGTSGPFTGADNINSQECSFSLYIKDNGRGDEDNITGKITDPVIVIYNKPTTTIIPANTTTNIPANTTTNIPANTTTNIPANTTTNIPANTTTIIPANTTTNIDDCSPNPCQNGGNCTDKINSYTCACKAGYIYTNCTKDIRNLQTYALAASNNTYNRTMALEAYKFIQNVNITNDNVKALVAAANLLCLFGQQSQDTILINSANTDVLLYYRKVPNLNAYMSAAYAYDATYAAATAAYTTAAATAAYTAAATAAAYAAAAYAEPTAAYQSYQVKQFYSSPYDAVINAYWAYSPPDIDAALTCAAGLIYLNVYTLLTR
jgi:hypothetical protein